MAGIRISGCNYSRAIARVRDSMNMYGEHGRAGFAAWLIFLLGGGLIAMGRLEGAVPLGMLAWVNRRQLITRMSDLLLARPWLVLALPIAAFVARAVYEVPAAADDLLRHILLGYWPEGYSSLYVYSAPIDTTAYYSFERLLGVLARAFGAPATMWITQATLTAAFIAVFVAAAFRAIQRDQDDRALYVLFALVLVISSVAFRLSLARPEFFFSVWAIAAFLPRNRVQSILWAGAGLAMSTGYWLALVYFPAALLLPLSRRWRVAIFVGMGIGWSVTWSTMMSGRPLAHLLALGQALGSRVPDAVVGENISVVNLLASPGVLLLTLLAFVGLAGGRGEKRILVLAAYFSLANQIRYVSIIAPLLAIYAATALPRLPAVNASARVGAVVVATMLATTVAGNVATYRGLPAFRLPDRSVVLSEHSVATYSVPFFNLGKVSIGPSAEIGASERWLQEVALGLGRGQFDCSAVDGKGFTHLVEMSLRGSPPPCLALIETQRGWRLWSFQLRTND